jgi:CHAD domain-containing protein
MLQADRDVALRYAADESFDLPSLTGLVAGVEGSSPLASGVPLSEGEVEHHRLDATYFDTEDNRLAAAGLTLRRRTGGNDSGWHLDVPAGTTTRTAVRLPPGRVPPGRTPRSVPAQLRSMVWALTFGAPLLPVARIRTERTVRRVADATGQVLAEVADDRVTARRILPTDGAGEAAGAETSWREIEVELSDGGRNLVDRLDGRLRDHGLRDAPAPSALAHFLGRNGTGSRPGRAGKKLTTASRSGDVMLAHIRTQVAQVQAQDLPVRLDAPDAVHKMRVATRRLRSALSTFKPLFDPAVVRPLRAELKWLAGELGAARDAEVMRDRVRTAVAGEASDPALRSGADAALSQLTETYRTAHDRVLAELDSDRYHRILGVLHALVEEPPLRKPAKRPAGKVLPRLVARGYDHVRDIVEDAQARPAGAERDELFHDARKAAKQARYAGESVAPVFGRDATAYAQAMENVQEVLGEHQDSALTRDRLRDLAVHASSTEVAFLYGRLHALEEARAQQSHARFDSAWKDAGRKSLHRWLR